MSTPPPPFGVSQYTTWPQSFDDDLALYREAGIGHIEVCEAKLDEADPEPQLERLRASGLRVASVQPRLHSLFPDAPRPEPREPRERMALLRKTMARFGRHFPGTTLVTIPGAVPDGDYALGYRTAAREYREAAKAAADLGVRLALEPLNPILMNVDTFLCSLAQAERVVAEVDHSAFGLFVDVWHIWEDEGAPRRLEQAGDRIFGVHVNDWRTPRAFGDRCLPGEGEIPLVSLLRAIRRSGYAGAYTLELFSETRLEGSLWADPRRTVTEGKKAFEKIWREACA